MILRLKERLGKRFEEEVQFFKGWQKDKKGVGALIPTSVYAARRMASVVNPRSGLPILELGAGTGVITKAILARGIKPRQLVSVEYSRIFYDGLVQRSRMWTSDWATHLRWTKLWVSAKVNSSIVL